MTTDDPDRPSLASGVVMTGLGLVAFASVEDYREAGTLHFRRSGETIDRETDPAGFSGHVVLVAVFGSALLVAGLITIWRALRRRD